MPGRKRLYGEDTEIRPDGLPPELHDWLKAHAEEQSGTEKKHISMAAIMRRALEEYRKRIESIVHRANDTAIQ